MTVMDDLHGDDYIDALEAELTRWKAMAEELADKGDALVMAIDRLPSRAAPGAKMAAAIFRQSLSRFKDMGSQDKEGG